MDQKHIFYLFLCMTSISFSQTKQWKIDTEDSYILYKGEHVLHSREGINKNVNGVAIPNAAANAIEKIAILVYVRDFDSNNSGRDAHALEVLEALKYPEIRFYSEQITIKEDQLQLKGSFDFHGIKIEKTLLADLKRKSSTWEISGNFQLTPTDFKIKLPSFLSIKMKNILDIEYSMVLTQ